MKIDRNEVVEI
ncbi:hypothetical protein VCHC67A1_03397A, partial [Vibrio cholerae HC-67A1]